MLPEIHLQKLRRSRRATSRGFTLLELLVVITIIGILLALGMSQFNRDPGVSSSRPVVEARISEARTLAMGEQTKTRVVIHNDPSDADNPERFLRYMDIAVEEKGADGEATGNWISVGSHGYLPQGVFFDPDTSAKASALVEAANPALDGSSITGFGTWSEGLVEFSGPPVGAQACYFFEFNPEGICIHEGSTTPGAAVILSRGIPQDGEEPRFDGSDKVGLVIWRNGSTSIYRDTADLKDDD